MAGIDEIVFPVVWCNEVSLRFTRITFLLVDFRRVNEFGLESVFLWAFHSALSFCLV